jgi:hypothetical protein
MRRASVGFGNAANSGQVLAPVHNSNFGALTLQGDFRQPVHNDIFCWLAKLLLGSNGLREPWFRSLFSLHTGTTTSELSAK